MCYQVPSSLRGEKLSSLSKGSPGSKPRVGVSESRLLCNKPRLLPLKSQLGNSHSKYKHYRGLVGRERSDSFAELRQGIATAQAGREFILESLGGKSVRDNRPGRSAVSLWMSDSRTAAWGKRAGSCIQKGF